MDRVDNVHFNFRNLHKNSIDNEFLVHLEIPMSVGWIDSSFLVIDGNTIPLTYVDNNETSAIFEGVISLKQRAVYQYYFEYYADGKRHIINNHNTKDTINYDEKNKLSVMFDAPEWAKGAMMYHIFVDRFYHAGEDLEPMPRRVVHKDWDEDVVLGVNPDVEKKYPGEEIWNVDFFGGNLKGIEEKLDYLESLGITLLYLSPIMKSQSNHRYDTADYESVDPYAGCNEDLKNLCEAAHKRGMKVIIDAVFNHVGDESKYFDRYGEYVGPNPKENGIYQSGVSKYYDFFNYNEHGKNTFWWNFPTLPELNSDSNFWREYICGEGGVIDKWFALGIDGLRLDVADNLSDPALEEIHKAVIRNKEDGFILGEVWDNPMRNGRSYISSGKSMHSVMNYPLVDGLVRYFKYKDPRKLEYTIRDTFAEYPKCTIDTLMNFTSTHDISRAITLLGKRKFDGKGEFSKLEDYFKHKIYESLWELGFNQDAIVSLLTGKSEINYYTYCSLINKLQEKGIYGDALEHFKNSFSYTPFDPDQGWAKDLPDDVKKDLEFTKNYKLTPEEYIEAKKVYEAYLFFLAAYPGIFSIFYGDEVGMQGLNNLANRRSFPWNNIDKELLSYVQTLGQFRKKYPFLRKADFRLLELTPEVVTFERMDDKNKMFIAVNNTDSDKEIYLPSEYRDGEKVLTLKRVKNNCLSSYGGVIIKK